MGAFSAIQAQAKTFKLSSPLGQWIVSELKKRADADIPTAAAVTDAVHTIAQDGTDHTGGTFALTVTLRNGEAFTTAAIAFNAVAATIETAIDVAATAATITGWTNGDITVAGGVLQAVGAAVTLTFDGTSVLGTAPDLTVFDGALLTGGAEPATRVARTTAGQTSRPAMGIMLALGIVSGTPPIQSAVASTTGVTKGSNLVSVPDNIVKALMREASAEDDNSGTYFSLQAALYPQDRAPMVSTTKTSDIF